jgi:hypothetical protein
VSAVSEPSARSWSALSVSAKALRAFHIGVGIVGLSSLVYVWICALTGRRDQVLVVAVAALLVEGAAILIGRGNCPLGPLQQRLGDPTPLFAQVLPPRWAKAAFPVLITATLAGFALLAVRYVART